MSIADESKYRKRIIDAQVDKYLKIFGAVCIEGPKWCGKTWTSSVHSRSEFLIGSPENNFQNRRLAEISPDIVLEGETPRLLDEWQEVPSIWDAVRYFVDKRGEKAQYILTGSSTPKAKGILHSGAGRIGKLRMRTMSLYESGDSTGQVSLEELCAGKLTPAITGEVKLENLIYYAVRGGWPGNLGIEPELAQVLPTSYIRAILDDDSQRVDGIRYDKHKMELLLRSLARNESTTASNNKLLRDINDLEFEDIDRTTVSQYLDVFLRMFLIDNQQPFSSNVRSSNRIKQAEKRHFCDPALACALIDATPERLMNDLNLFGFIFEAMCERDLRIYAEAFDAKIYHYQDYRNREIDAVIENKDGSWCAFEIKLGANHIEQAAKNLKKISVDIGEEKDGVPPKVLCVICGMSNAAYRREDGVFVVPITALRP